MIRVETLAFDLLINACVHIAVFATMAGLVSPLIAKTRATFQHWCYLAAFLLCFAALGVNTFRRSDSPSRLARPVAAVATGANAGGHFIGWPSLAPQFAPPRTLREGVLAIWGALALYYAVRFGRGLRRVYRLRRTCAPLSSEEQKNALAAFPFAGNVVLLSSTAVREPVTVGAISPAIVFPESLVSRLDQQELAAVLAHEFGHIRRKDFLVNCLAELAAVPVSWHPGVRYLMSKLSQTRELACDDYAADRVGKRAAYARTLLRLASLCVHPRANAIGLGIFDGDNLENRIMKLTSKQSSLSRIHLLALTLAFGTILGGGAALANAVSLQASPQSTAAMQRFAGTWHWMFKGHSFATMVLVPQGSGFTGTVTGSRIALDGDGYLKKADPPENASPNPISKADVEGNALHVTVMDAGQPFEFVVTLKDSMHAEVRPVGAPAFMKPIPADKAN